ncbi:uncharacterized protein LOC131840833 [Achroia grisella]|uniref:uncharacterized protein LOC131840833 n=1 Tax=Achroia grisella TaxID=688607 RepID=UPI0027D22257|nr:uncharacterized protein LOC131840833 [Achroia grisella]
METRSLKCIVIFLFIFNTIYKVNGGCTLDLNKDFGLPSAVYIRDGEFLTPDDAGTISLRRSETILVACPGRGRRVVTANVTTGIDSVEAHCIVNSTFRVGRWIGQFTDIRCNMFPTATVEEMNGGCYKDNSLIRVGYTVKNKIFPLYEACFDRALLTTLYVKYELTPRNLYHQSAPKHGSRKFYDTHLFSKVNINKAYKQQNQRLDALLGPGMYKKYVSGAQYLSRGHLAARADFIMRGQQQASYHYVNCAPQWQRGNAGDWTAVESALRQRINTYGSPVTVYTGTMGVMSLADDKGHPQNLYLDDDENNNGVLPVPLYFFKLVYDPRKKTAAAFVSINSSFYNRTVVDRLTFCDESCERHDWLRWRPSDGTHSFCCDYAALARAVEHVPKLDVKGTFI